jgi:hypothetical protein
MSRRNNACRAVGLVLATSWVVLANTGCSHLVETRSVTRFTGAFEAGDIAALREATTPEFRRRALRDKSAVEALELLELPEGEMTVTEVEEISSGRRRVKVEYESDDGITTPLTFELSRNGTLGAWLVDDVLLKQSRRGRTVTRSATELMDLLLSVNEFQLAWQSGDRKRLLDSTTDELSSKLARIPPLYLEQLATRVAVRDGRTFSSRPKASLEGDTAHVRYDGPEGETVLAWKLGPSGWRVDDIVFSARSSKRQPESVRLLVSVIAQAAGFLDAFNQADRKQLEQHASSSFFTNCLARADLSQVQLPKSLAIDSTAEVRLQKTCSDIVIRQPDGLARISLEREPASDPASELSGERDASSRGFRVSEVTLVDSGSSQERRLSAVFTAHARLRLFLAAVRQHDLAAIRHNSSTDFNTRVWRQLTPEVLPNLLGLVFSTGRTEVSGTVFQGAITEITVSQGTKVLTCVLRDQNGVLLVDDILVPSTTLPGSIKKQFERLIPVFGFHKALLASDPKQLAQNSSVDFNRLVWSQVGDRLPLQANRAARFLDRRVSRMRTIEDDREELVLGDRQFGARVVLVNERSRFRVDDIELYAGDEPGTAPTFLKQVLRLEIARPRNRDRVESKESRSPDPTPAAVLSKPTAG